MKVGHEINWTSPIQATTVEDIAVSTFSGRGAIMPFVYTVLVLLLPYFCTETRDSPLSKRYVNLSPLKIYAFLCLNISYPVSRRFIGQSQKPLHVIETVTGMIILS